MLSSFLKALPDMCGDWNSLMRPMRVAMTLGVLLVITNNRVEARTFSELQDKRVSFVASYSLNLSTVLPLFMIMDLTFENED